MEETGPLLVLYFDDDRVLFKSRKNARTNVESTLTNGHADASSPIRRVKTGLLGLTEMDHEWASIV